MSWKQGKQVGFDKEALKALRESRKAWIEKATSRMREQKKKIRAIRDHLKNGPQTVPAIASAIGAETAEVLWYVATLKKYGEVREAEKDGPYFMYELAEEKAVEATD